jgi:acyl-CoA synthetase (NDP forming)
MGTLVSLVDGGDRLGNKDQIISNAVKQGRVVLTEIESKKILEEAGINTIEARLARSQKEAMSLSSQIGFPVVLKISSPDISHKSDAGGVKVGLKNKTEVGRAYKEIVASVRQKCPAAGIEGVSVQSMARPGIEVIIGMSKDPQFGPVLMFGLGGILVEVLKDVSFRIVPLTRRDAKEMIREIKGYPLLDGYRGQEPANIPFLEELLLKISGFAEQNPQIKEFDLNPIFAYKDGAVAVDARIILEDSASEEETKA